MNEYRNNYSCLSKTFPPNPSFFASPLISSHPLFSFVAQPLPPFYSRSMFPRRVNRFDIKIQKPPLPQLSQMKRTDIDGRSERRLTKLLPMLTLDVSDGICHTLSLLMRNCQQCNQILTLSPHSHSVPILH